MKDINWGDVEKAMKEGVVKVTFVKADGTIREMDCTLMSYLLPETKGNKREPNPDLMVVFDIEIEAWRSFRKDSVLDIEVY